MGGDDYSIQVKVRNGPLLRAMRENGCWTVSALCIGMGTPGRQCEVGDYLNLKKVPINPRGEWRPLVIRMADFLKRLPEDLFPPQHIHQALKTNVAEIDASLDDVAGLLADHGTPETALIEAGNRDVLYEALESLGPRRRRIIELRFGLGGEEPLTLKQVGKVMGISGDRVRQMEVGALAKLRRPGVLRKLELTG